MLTSHWTCFVYIVIKEEKLDVFLHKNFNSSERKLFYFRQWGPSNIDEVHIGSARAIALAMALSPNNGARVLYTRSLIYSTRLFCVYVITIYLSMFLHSLVDYIHLTRHLPNYSLSRQVHVYSRRQHYTPWQIIFPSFPLPNAWPDLERPTRPAVNQLGVVCPAFWRLYFWCAFSALHYCNDVWTRQRVSDALRYAMSIIPWSLLPRSTLTAAPVKSSFSKLPVLHVFLRIFLERC